MSSDELVAASQPLKKDRHIVSWTPEEDDVLREQVSSTGTDNWTSIAAKFKDKTSRQCRRRWYTYLNSEGKKGGWSVEEDMILCEAQKIFGNRWTEIAKVVSGRTDNAVKNRFSTLCKKRAKHEVSSKENINPNNKRVILQSGSIIVGTAKTSAPIELTRQHISDLSENHNPNDMLPRTHVMTDVQLTPPLSMLVQNLSVASCLPSQYYDDNKSNTPVYDVSSNRIQGTFLKRDDPKLTALLQQADLLSSLALKVNSDDTDQSLEHAWKELQDYLIHTQDGEELTRTTYGMDFSLEDFRDLIEDLKSSSTEGQQVSSSPPSRQSHLHESSQGSTECSSLSIQLSQGHRNVKHQIEDRFTTNDVAVSSHESEIPPVTSSTQVGVMSSSIEPQEVDGNICTIPNSRFESPLQTVPTFQSLAEGIPSPKFSASERQFLRSVLGVKSPGSSPSSSQLPSCKRALLDSL